MRLTVITLFPGYFDGPVDAGVVGRAVRDGTIDFRALDLREHGLGRHRQVDDAPFGGGAGMVLMIEPIAAALEAAGPGRRVLLTPAGAPLRQEMLDRWSELDDLILLCGRYEGVDERVAEHLMDEEVSVGDFVLAGGEAAALVIVEGLARLVPGVVGNPESTDTESFRGEGLLEEPQYTRPAQFQGWAVPEVLLSGDHGKVEEWRRRQRLDRTSERRPDLLPDFSTGDESG